MKSCSKKIISLILVFVLIISCTMTVFGADFDYVSIVNGILSGGTVDLSSINIVDIISQGVEEEINKETIIDKIIDNIKNPENLEEDDDTAVEVDSVERAFAVELFNLTVNRIKTEMPAATVTQNSGLNSELSGDLGTLGYSILGGIAKSAASTDVSAAAAAIKAMSAETATSHTIKKGESCNELVPLTGSEYVSTLKAEQVSGYKMVAYKNGAYSIHLEFPTVYGSAKETGIGAVADVTANSTFSVNLISGTSVDTNVYLKYSNCYAEVAVNRKGEITAYNTHIEVSASSTDGKEQSAGQYVDTIFKTLEKEGVVYVMETQMSGFNWDIRELGDINNDTKINTNDARSILRKIAKLDEITDIEITYGDIDGNGKLNLSDASKILRYVARLDTLPDIRDRIEINEDEKTPAQIEIDNLLITILALQAEKSEKESETTKESTATEKQNVDTSEKDSEQTTDITDYSKYVNDGMQLVNDILNGIFGKK